MLIGLELTFLVHLHTDHWEQREATSNLPGVAGDHQQHCTLRGEPRSICELQALAAILVDVITLIPPRQRDQP